jgi:phosphoglycolate phosphatase-like HAD superfamily hydrolase
MEILKHRSLKRPQLKVALFDFDGTLSTLRHGWEQVMEPFMIECIAGATTPDAALVEEVRSYIDQSTGIQTYYQMEWLAATVKRYGRNSVASDDPWSYKAEYNRRLMRNVSLRKERIESGRVSRSDFLMKGSEAFLRALNRQGVEIHVASGTDDLDVKKEAELLGLDRYVKEIAGAPAGRADCSKEAVLKKLIEENHLQGEEVVVFGDGKVEIALGRAMGAVTVGVASDEIRLQGVDPVKRQRLVHAGADAVIDCFEPLDELLLWLGLKAETGRAQP